MVRSTFWRWLLPLLVGAVPLLAQNPAPAAVPATNAAPTPAPTSAPAPMRVAPTRPAAPQLWPVVRLHNSDFIDVRDVAARFGLKPEWSHPELTLTLADARGVRLSFEAKQRDFYIDGLRVFLGEAPLLEKGTLWLTKLDVIKIVAPLLRPADRLDQLPAVRPHVIVLDPGHGGSDPGKENRRIGIREKDMTLDVAQRLKPMLEAQGWKVLLTRTDDRELSLSKKSDLQLRDDFAVRNQADLFLSIHFNSVERDTERVAGVEVYTMTPQFMLSSAGERQDDMTTVAYPGNKFDFASLLLGEQLSRAMLMTLKTPDRGFKRGRLAVLRLLNCPGALVECAYLSNETEARRVATPEYRDKVARGLALGIANYAAALAALRPAVVNAANGTPAAVTPGAPAAAAVPAATPAASTAVARPTAEPHR